MPATSLATPESLPAPRGGGARNPPRPGRPIFLVALLAGLALHVVALVVFRVRLTLPAQPQRPAALVQYSGATGARTDEVNMTLALLLDPEPVFLPTVHNFASRMGTTPGLPVQTPLPSLSFNPALKKADFQLFDVTAAAQLTPPDILKSTQWEILDAFGQASASGRPSAPRGAWLRVVRTTTGFSGQSRGGADNSVVRDEPLAEAEFAAPKAVSWGPATFSILFSATGMAGEPLLINSLNSSLDNNVDRILQTQVDQYLRRHPLPPGSYKVTVGP